jgi:hypothetical protein
VSALLPLKKRDEVSRDPGARRPERRRHDLELVREWEGFGCDVDRLRLEGRDLIKEVVERRLPDDDLGGNAALTRDHSELGHWGPSTGSSPSGKSSDCGNPNAAAARALKSSDGFLSPVVTLST